MFSSVRDEVEDVEQDREREEETTVNSIENEVSSFDVQ
jgi:hypothetical protein